MKVKIWSSGLSFLTMSNFVTSSTNLSVQQI